MFWFIGFFVCWAFVELLVMMLSVYDDYGENWLMSLIFSIVIIIGIAIVTSTVEDADQETMLEAQWSEEEIEDLLTIEAIEQKEVNDYYNDVERVGGEDDDDYNQLDPPPVKQKQTVPANRAYIENDRRNYEIIVTYDHETREACDDIECFNVQLIQHTDGTYWACKRNYGVCYGY